VRAKIGKFERPAVWAAVGVQPVLQELESWAHRRAAFAHGILASKQIAEKRGVRRLQVPGGHDDGELVLGPGLENPILEIAKIMGRDVACMASDKGCQQRRVGGRDRVGSNKQHGRGVLCRASRRAV
jgi:hypothetical protein